MPQIGLGRRQQAGVFPARARVRGSECVDLHRIAQPSAGAVGHYMVDVGRVDPAPVQSIADQLLLCLT